MQITANKWTRHTGGVCPCNPDDFIHIMTLDNPDDSGDVETAWGNGTVGNGPASRFDWASGITHWRLHHGDRPVRLPDDRYEIYLHPSWDGNYNPDEHSGAWDAMQLMAQMTAANPGEVYKNWI